MPTERMNDLITYDPDKLNAAIEWFAHFIAVKQGGKTADFYNGYMSRAEGYKREIFTNAHNALHLEEWAESDIGSRKILNRVIAALHVKDNKNFNNIIDYHGVTHLQTAAEANIAEAEDILFRLFISEDIETAFSDACDFFGKRYPELSYLLFMRDCARFLPVKNSKENHPNRFLKLGFPTDCLSVCTWENYQAFLAIHQLVRTKLEAAIDKPVSLLDAHSFIWTLYHAPMDLHISEEASPRISSNGTHFIADVSSAIQYSKQSEGCASQLDEEIDSLSAVGLEKAQLVKIRINQGTFRKRLLKRYAKCCLCGVQNESFLVASHIKPWAECSPLEKLDVNNGLLLCPNHDRLFDQGWITFSEDGKIMISEQLTSTDRLFLNVDEAMSITLYSGNGKYLDYHRGDVFKDSRAD